MINYKRLISASILLTVTGLAVAQTSTNSPYTRYGFGQLADQNFGNSKAMGGIAYGLRNGYQINASNPASYTAIDSLTFLFDAGMTLQNANFKDGNVKPMLKTQVLTIWPCNSVYGKNGNDSWFSSIFYSRLQHFQNT